MKICCFSDKHSRNIKLPKADMIIYAGDMTNSGTEEELCEFKDWFSSLEYEHKVCIAGNHDRCLESNKAGSEFILDCSNIIYLNDNLAYLPNLNIYGSPIVPPILDWAFLMNGTQRNLYWSKLIGLEPDIIVTHCPPFGILDSTNRGENLGCPFLRAYSVKVRPKLHVFGHIHESSGITSLKQIIEERGGKWDEKKDKDTIFVNAYNPIVVEI